MTYILRALKLFCNAHSDINSSSNLSVFFSIDQDIANDSELGPMALLSCIQLAAIETLHMFTHIVLVNSQQHILRMCHA